MGWPQDKKDQYTSEFNELAQQNGVADRGGAHNGVMDAYRHAFVSGRFTQEYGSIVAHTLGDAHEYKNPNPAAEHTMDYHNNAVGREFGGKTKGPNELFQSLMQNEDRMILNIGGQPGRTYGAADQQNNGAQYAGNSGTSPQQIAAFNNLVEQGMTIHQSNKGEGFIVSGSGEFPQRQLVQNLEQFADAGKAREIAQAITPQTQNPERDAPTRTMSA